MTIGRFKMCKACGKLIVREMYEKKWIEKSKAHSMVDSVWNNVLYHHKCAEKAIYGTFNCEVCGKEVRYRKSKRKNPRFCSKQCQAKKLNENRYKKDKI